jgi:hypothetical protein
MTQAATTKSLRSLSPAAARCRQRDGPSRIGPRERSQTATPPSIPLRIKVERPTGEECSCPKQWQSGLRPRAKLTAIPSEKIASRASAAQAPYHANASGTSATATAISAAESSKLRGCARAGGRPKSLRALLAPWRSASFATPARKNTADSRSLASNRASSNMLEIQTRSTRRRAALSKYTPLGSRHSSCLLPGTAASMTGLHHSNYAAFSSVARRWQENPGSRAYVSVENVRRIREKFGRGWLSIK